MRRAIVFLLACALLAGCKITPRRTYTQHTRHPVRRVVNVRAQRSAYRDVQEKLAARKQEIKEHIRVYEMSMNADDPLNRREDPIAHAQIIESAKALQADCDEALKNGTMLKTVSGSKRNIRLYREYAKDILRKYEGGGPPSSATPGQH